MMVVVDHGLTDVESSLADEVFEFLPATMGWDLLLSDEQCDGDERNAYTLEKEDEFLIRRSRLRTSFFASWHCDHSIRSQSQSQSQMCQCPSSIESSSDRLTVKKQRPPRPEKEITRRNQHMGRQIARQCLQQSTGHWRSG